MATELGNAFGKPDMERLGIFSEMPYMNGKGYVSPFPKPNLVKGKNIIGEGPHTKRAKQDCYFDKEFKRIFTGEAIKGRGRKEKPKVYKKIADGPLLPPDGFKLHSTPGDYYGCFGKVEYFSNVRRKAPPYKHEEKNCITNPGRKGGCGYIDICINKYPAHSVDRYGAKQKFKAMGVVLNGPMITSHYPSPYFESNPYMDPPNIKPGRVYVKPKEKRQYILPPGKIIPIGKNKLPGGMYFDKFPEHGDKPDKYMSTYDIHEKHRKLKGTRWDAHAWTEKSMFTTSIIKNSCRFRVNQVTYANYEPTYVKHLVN